VPVRLEHLTQPTPADWADLEKIHNETAPHGLATPAALQDWCDETHWFIGGRFNDRIIGAILAERHNNTVHLSAAGVRKITQRRGVMHQLLHFVCRWANEEALTLTISDSKDSLSEAIQRRGFEADGELLVYKPH